MRWWAAMLVGIFCLLVSQWLDHISGQETYLELWIGADRQVSIVPRYMDLNAKVHVGDGMFVGPGTKPHIARVFLPPGRFKALTLAVKGEDTNLLFAEIRVKNVAGTLDQQLPLLENARGLGGYEPVPEGGGIRLKVDSSEATPVLAVISEKSFGRPPANWWPRPGAITIGILAAALVLAFPMLLVRRPAATWEDAWQVVTARPKTAIVLVGVAGALISVLPVFTSGRGFVGPYLGGHFLMDGEVTLPGQGTEILVPPSNGVDVAALQYTALGQLRQATESLWNSGELMLWDRFNSSGATYLGQGMFLYLCPFIWPVLLLGGSVSSWTWSFVLAKTVFPVAMGIYLSRLNLRLPVVLGVTVVCGFLGVFSYRAAHFAFFAVAAFPVIMLGYDGMLASTTVRWKRLAAMGMWLLGCLACFCGGALKEAVFVMLVSHLLVLFHRCSGPKNWSYLRGIAVTTAMAGMSLVLLLAPLWLSFFGALENAGTVYDAPRFLQMPLTATLAIFDEFFGRNHSPRYAQCLPSANLLFLPGFIFALMGSIVGTNRGRFVAPVVTGLACMAMAFEVIPGDLFYAVPFLNNLHTLYNAFGVAALPAIIVGSAMGWDFWCGYVAQGKSWTRIGIGLGLLGASLISLGGISMVVAMKYGFSAYLPVALGLMGGVFLLTFCLTILHGCPSGSSTTRRLVLVGMACLTAALLCGRYAFFANNSLTPWMFVLPERVRGSAASEATDWLKQQVQKQPGRVVGIRDTLFPGTQVYYGLEGIGGAMPLRLEHYWDLMFKVPGGELVWHWAFIADADDLGLSAPFLEFLNCRYVVGMPGQVYAGGGPPVVHGSDLEVRELPLAWPRAFFVGEVRVIDGVDAFVNLVNQRPGPFCAVSTETRAANPGLEPLITEAPDNPREVVPARDYELTLNNTSFTVEAGGPGMIVLHEAFEPGVFQVRVNGQPAEPLRVNYAFRGLRVPAAGTYRVEYRYWPPVLTVALWMSACGIVAFVVLACALFKWRPSTCP